MISTNNTRRPTIALFVPELETDYPDLLCRGVIDAAEEKDINLIIFPGNSPKSPIDNRYQYSVIYDFVNSKCIDAVIMASGSLSNYLTKAEFVEFYSRFQPIPIVSISIELEGIPSVLINNQHGLKQALDHIIKYHKKRRIVFIRGTTNNVEAEERYLTYLNALEENNIPFNPEMVYEGDFTSYSGIKAIETLVDKKNIQFEAIVAANDEMALSAMFELQKRNYRIPEDIAVIGFDNIEGTKFSKPSMTTVKQPVYEQAKKAVEIAVEIINGKKPENIKMNTELLIRESCGCVPEVLNIHEDTKEVSVFSHKFTSEIDEIVKLYVSNLNPKIFIIDQAEIFVGECFKYFMLSNPQEKKI